MQEQPHILIVDDDNRILKLLKKFLSQNNFFVSTSTSPKEALLMLENFSFDLIILDVMMPEITGIDFAQQIKASKKKLPIVMLTALSEPEDRIKGLEVGANDYITKPFEPRELLLRIHNLIESHKIFKREQEIIRFGNCEYNVLSKELTQNAQDINLSSTEERLLEVLMEHKNTPLSREKLGEIMGGLNPRSIDVQIVRLRSKIEIDPKNPKLLKTIRNQGYILYTS